MKTFFRTVYIKLESLIKLLIGFISKNDYVWYLINLNAIKKYNLSKPVLGEHEQKLLQELKKYGIAVTNLDAFSTDIFSSMTSWANEKKKSYKYDERKDYFKYFVGGSYNRDEPQHFDSYDPLIEFSINKKLLSVVNSYFKMFSRLIYLELNETKILNLDSETKASQNLHRDPGVRGCIKAFVYFNDVEENGGAFTYIKQTHLNGKHGSLFKKGRFLGVGSFYPNEEEIKTKIDPENIFEAVGKAGTVIIADTSGIHKGGFSTNQSRIMSTSVFFPPGEFHKTKLIYDFNLKDFKLSEEQIFALKD